MTTSQSGARHLSPWATTGWGLILFLSWSLSQLVGMLAAMAFRALRQAPPLDAAQWMENGDTVALATVAGTAGGVLVLWAVVRMSGSRMPGYLTLKTPLPGTLARSLAVILAVVVATDTLSWLLGRDIVTAFQYGIYQSAGSRAFLLLAVVVAAPLFEEMFFRGFLFEGWRRSRLGNTGAALLTSLLWACLHLQYGPYEITSIFLLGLVLCVLRLKSHSLWPCVAGHAMAGVIAMAETAYKVGMPQP